MTALKDILGGLSGGRILDVATESGTFIDRLRDGFKNFDEVIGIDIVDKHFEKARERLKDDRVSFVVMDGAKIEFADESFDTVAMCAGMHHLTDIPAVLSEMMRVLKSGGAFVLREMFRDGLNEKQMTDVLQHDWSARIDLMTGRPHFPSLTRQGILNHVDSLGLSRFDILMYRCDDCPRASGETIEKEVEQMREQLEKVAGLPEYDELRAEMESIVDRLRTVGVVCQPALDIVGFK